jgi:hypothetical protein
MTNMSGEFIHLIFGVLSRRPVLTVVLVFMIAFGTVAFAVWLRTSSNSNPRRTGFPYLVWIGEDAVITKGKSTCEHCY